MLGGNEKGYISFENFHSLFDENMPKMFDRDLAMELFRELDSDKDMKLTYKDFSDSMKFQF